MKANLSVNSAVRILLLVVVIFLAYILFIKLRIAVGDEAKVGICEQSVWANSQRLHNIAPGAAIIPGIDKSLAKIDCPKTQLKIDGSYDEELAKKAIAKKMMDCYKKMGEGELVPFDTSWFTNNDMYCVICSEVKFSNSFKKKHETINDLTNYLFTTKINPTDETTYGLYLTKASSYDDEIDEEYVGEAQLVKEEYTTAEDYIILFTLSKEGQLWKTAGIGAGAIGGGTVGGIIAGGIVALIPIPGARVAAASLIIPPSVLTGAGTGALAGLALGSQRQTHQIITEGAWVSTAFIQEKNLQKFDCKALYQ